MNGWNRFVIQAESFTPEFDGDRQLGIFVEDVRIEPPNVGQLWEQLTAILVAWSYNDRDRAGCDGFTFGVAHIRPFGRGRDGLRFGSHRVVQAPSARRMQYRISPVRCVNLISPLLSSS
jgi:hypothetical protein